MLGQYEAVLVGNWWYWVSLGQYGLIYDVYWVSMKRNCLIHYNTGSVEGSSGQYLVVLGHYNLVLLGFKWKWVSTRLVCLYLLKKSGDLVGCYHSGTDGRTDKRTRKDRATQPMDHGRLR